MKLDAYRKVQARLLEEQIREAKADADIRELELATKQDQERDRLVKSGRVRHLSLYGPIYDNLAEQWIDALQHWERRDPGEPIEITINSPGGSVTAGLAVYDTIQRLRRKGHRVVTHGQGMVASMAGILLQAGDERLIDERAKMMIHEGSMVLRGDTALSAGEAEDMRVFQDMLRSDILDILTERANITKAQLARKWKRRDWWLTAADAVKHGFADRIE